MTVKEAIALLRSVQPLWMDTPLVTGDGAGEQPDRIQYRMLTNTGGPRYAIDRVALVTGAQVAAYRQPPAWLGPGRPPAALMVEPTTEAERKVQDLSAVLRQIIAIDSNHRWYAGTNEGPYALAKRMAEFGLMPAPAPAGEPITTGETGTDK